MKKQRLIPLAIAGLFSGAGMVLACDYNQQDASTDATQMMSVGTPTVTATAKPDSTAVAGKKAIAKTTKKTLSKSEAVTLAVQRN